MSLFDQVSVKLSDPNTVAVSFEDVLEPVQGAGAAICPPTYANPGGKGKPPLYAVTPNTFVPAPASDGWYRDLTHGPDGPRLAARVVVNSVPACARASELAIYLNQQRFGITLPAIVVGGKGLDDASREAALRDAAKAAKVVPTETHRESLKQALAVEVSTWESAHRTADSWLQYASEPGKTTQLWTDEQSELRQVLLNISHDDGDTTFTHAPNAAAFGSWLSAGSARRHAIPRAYACEIVGYGVHEVVRGATKLDAVGGAVNDARQVKADGLGIALDAKGKRPSEFGFGQVPVSPATRAFSCELILRQGSVSLNALRQFKYKDDASGEKAFAATRVYVLLAMLGHALSGLDTFIRSGCDLVSVEERWGWRRHGAREVDEFPVPSIDDLGDALRAALDAAAEVGLAFAAPQSVVFSAVELGLIADRVVAETQSVQVDGD